jgi:hypothetical protein
MRPIQLLLGCAVALISVPSQALTLDQFRELDARSREAYMRGVADAFLQFEPSQSDLRRRYGQCISRLSTDGLEQSFYSWSARSRFAKTEVLPQLIILYFAQVCTKPV